MMELSERFHRIVELAIDDYKSLQRLNPQHELLGLINVSKSCFEVIKGEEFERRFLADKGIASSLYCNAFAVLKYERALRNAIREELEKKLEQQELLGMARKYL